MGTEEVAAVALEMASVALKPPLTDGRVLLPWNLRDTCQFPSPLRAFLPGGGGGGDNTMVKGAN